LGLRLRAALSHDGLLSEISASSFLLRLQASAQRQSEQWAKAFNSMKTSLYARDFAKREENRLCDQNLLHEKYLRQILQKT
jgi:hypothetical protein